MQIIKPFGPSIVKLRMPDELVIGLNKYVEKIISDKNKSEELDYGSKLAGNVEQEFLLEKDFQKEVKWGDFLASSVQKWISFETKKIYQNLRL